MTRTAFLYRTTSKAEILVAVVTVPADVHADTDRNYRTTWCADNGYDSTHYLRTKRRIETTDAERRAMRRAHDSLKASGRLPSAFDTIAERLRAVRS